MERKPRRTRNGAAGCVALISKIKGNPYVSLLRDGLAQPGLGLQPEVWERFTAGWMWQQRRRVDVLHVHWLELLFVYPSLWHSLRRWLSVALGLLIARLHGIRIVYTAHNIWQHEGKRRALVWLGNWLMFRLADAVHVHDDGTAQALQQQWRPRGRVWVIPHGHYVSAYPNACTRQQARERLGLDARTFVYLSLGVVRPYKGIEELLVAFAQLDCPDATLIVAGRVHTPDYAARVRALAERDSRVQLHLGHVPGEELQFFFGACDICVLPYRQVTTSGAALLSFSFGVPVIAPRMGSFVQLVGDRPCGILYQPDDPDGLLGALAQAQRADLAAMRQACAELVSGLDWESIARQHAAMYRACR